MISLNSKFNSRFGLDSANRMVKYFNLVKVDKGNIPGLKAVSRDAGMLTLKYNGVPFKTKTSKETLYYRHMQKQRIYESKRS